MNDAQLRCFHVAATEGSITRAAARLGISQPTVSVQIKTLEEGYGVQLFRRVGRKIELTEFGEKLKMVTARLYTVQAEARDLLLSQRNLSKGHLRVGTIGPHQLFPVLKELGAKFPDITYGVQSGNSTAILDAVTRGDVDVGITTNLTPGNENLHIQFFRRDEVVLLVHRDHPLAKRKVVDCSELAGETIVVREHGSMMRSVFLQALATVDVIDPNLVVMETREATKEAVACDFGIAPELRSMAGHDERCAVVRLTSPAPTLDMYVACHREVVRFPIIRAFLDAANVVFRRFADAKAPDGVVPIRRSA